MAKKPAHAPHGAEWEGDWDGGDVGYEADVAPRAPRATARGGKAGAAGAASEAGEADDAPPARHFDTVAEVLAALPTGDAGRALKLALLDALEASARADRVALPVEVQGLRARVRAGTA